MLRYTPDLQQHTQPDAGQIHPRAAAAHMATCYPDTPRDYTYTPTRYTPNCTWNCSPRRATCHPDTNRLQAHTQPHIALIHSQATPETALYKWSHTVQIHLKIQPHTPQSYTPAHTVTTVPICTRTTTASTTTPLHKCPRAPWLAHIPHLDILCTHT